MYTEKGGREAEWVFAAMGLPLLALCKAVPRVPRPDSAPAPSQSVPRHASAASAGVEKPEHLRAGE